MIDEELLKEAERVSKGMLNLIEVVEKLKMIETMRKSSGKPERKEDGTAATAGHYYFHGARLEPIEAMQDWFSPEEFRGFLKGNLLKYLVRAGRKPGEPAEKDLTKAMQYLEWLRQAERGETINPHPDTAQEPQEQGQTGLSDV